MLKELNSIIKEGKIEEYMLAMQSLDNLRLSGYGIDNGGLFEKKAHELQTEADINDQNKHKQYHAGGDQCLSVKILCIAHLYDNVCCQRADTL